MQTDQIAEKIAAVEAILAHHGYRPALAREWMVDYDWSNAADHAEWIRATSAEEIADWIEAGQP